MAQRRKGRLLLIGGGERRDGEYRVLQHFVKEAGGKKARVLVCGAALDDSEGSVKEYEGIFEDLGAGEVWGAPITDRSEADGDEVVGRLMDSTAMFLTGGDQLRITSLMAGTRLGDRLKHRNDEGGYLIAGTSAGAAAMGSVMLLGGAEHGTVRRADVKIGPGLGYLRDSVVDTHFNERGRVSRLLTIFAQNSQVLGIGIDADTALDVHVGSHYQVIGSGTVTVFNGRVSFSNAARVQEDEPMAVSGVQLHVLVAGYGFDPQKMEVHTPYDDFGMESRTPKKKGPAKKASSQNSGAQKSGGAQKKSGGTEQKRAPNKEGANQR